MDRWEPPRAPASDQERGRRQPRGRWHRSRSWSEGGRVALVRGAVGLLFVAAGTAAGPRFWLLIAGGAAVLLLMALALWGERWGWGGRGARVCWSLDAVSLGLLTPLLVINLFAGTGDGPMLAAERSVYLQTGFVVVGILALMAIVDALMPLDASRRAGVALLPAALAIPALSSIYPDVRGATAAGALALVWIVAAVTTAVAHLALGRLADLVAFGAYAVFLAVGLLTVPELASLGGRDAPINAVHPLLLVSAGAALLLTPIVVNPRLGEDRDQSRRQRRAGPRRAA